MKQKTIFQYTESITDLNFFKNSFPSIESLESYVRSGIIRSCKKKFPKFDVVRRINISNKTHIIFEYLMREKCVAIIDLVDTL